MSTETELVARNVQRLRRERGISMGELARQSGLSKQTLSVVEGGLGNPTVDTLAALANALGVSLRRLVSEWGSPIFVQRAEEGLWVSEPDRSVRELGQIYGSGYVRSAVLRLARGTAPPGVRPPLDAGTLHHAYVVEGAARLGLEAETVDVAAGDFVRFPADVPHRFEALEDHCLLHLVTTMPQRVRFGPAD